MFHCPPVRSLHKRMETTPLPGIPLLIQLVSADKRPLRDFLWFRGLLRDRSFSKYRRTHLITNMAIRRSVARELMESSPSCSHSQTPPAQSPEIPIMETSHFNSGSITRELLYMRR